jgi:hypothetical protein
MKNLFRLVASLVIGASVFCAKPIATPKTNKWKPSPDKYSDSVFANFDSVAQRYLKELNIRIEKKQAVCKTEIEEQTDGSFLTLGHSDKYLEYARIYTDRKAADKMMAAICKGKCKNYDKKEYLTEEGLRIGISPVDYHLLKNECVARTLYPRNRVFSISPVYER